MNTTPLGKVADAALQAAFRALHAAKRGRENMAWQAPAGPPEDPGRGMSYCRWSTDDYQCDAYVYASSDGRTCHIASRRRVGRPSERMARITSEWLDGTTNFREWRRRIDRYDEELDALPSIDLTHAMAGKTFYTETAGEMAERLEELQSEGLNIPDYAILELHEEEGLDQ